MCVLAANSGSEDVLGWWEDTPYDDNDDDYDDSRHFFQQHLGILLEPRGHARRMDWCHGYVESSNIAQSNCGTNSSFYLSCCLDAFVLLEHNMSLDWKDVVDFKGSSIGPE
jgi:hypothetical protein